MTAKPCPFCGESSTQVQEGSTFRWRYVECNGCLARGPEVRAQTLGEGTAQQWEADAQARAIAAWNERINTEETP